MNRISLIHRSAWNRYSRKLVSRIVHSPGPIGPELPCNTPLYRTGPMHLATRLDGYSLSCISVRTAAQRCIAHSPTPIDRVRARRRRTIQPMVSYPHSWMPLEANLAALRAYCYLPSGWKGNWTNVAISANIAAWKRGRHIPLPRPQKS
jgi:hypothetical protein